MTQEATATLDTTISELYRLFREANRHFYKDALPVPQITVQAAGRIPAYGWCSTREIWQAGEERRYEINLSAEYVHRGPLACAETLLHELAHLWNLAVQKVRDVSGHQYHNTKYKAAAEAHGLTVEKMGRYGWAKTALTPETKAWVESLNLNPAAFSLARAGRYLVVPTEDGEEKDEDAGDDEQGDKEANDGQKGKLKRYACQCTNVRSAVELMAVCLKCNQPFILGAKAEPKKAQAG